jgi:hypothetical protein
MEKYFYVLMCPLRIFSAFLLRKGEMGNAYKVLVRKSQRMRRFERFRCRLVDSMTLHETGCEDVDP